MSEHMSVRDAPWTWKKRIDPRKVRGTYPFQSCEERIQTCSNLHGPRCDEDYSCRHKISCQNQLPQLQGGHESHKTPEEHPSSMSQSNQRNPTATAAGGGTGPTKRSLRAPLTSAGGACPTKRSLRAPLHCVPVKIQEIKFKIQSQVGQREPPTISVHSIPGCTMCSRKQQ